MNILDQYVRSVPHAQNAVDIFKGEWSSKLPLKDVSSGTIPLFEDARISWASDQLGGVKNKKVLELGPLEAGHSYMLEKMEASEIVSIEANTRAYVKCLIVKELLKLNRVRFICGDFIEYLKANQTKFDVCIASGVLYHMKNPVELLYLISKVSDNIFIWTHYYDKEVIENNSAIRGKFPSHLPSEYRGYSHILHRFEYKDALKFGGFCGGSSSYSLWMSRREILDCLNYFGFNKIQINFDQPNHPNGPSFAIVASRQQSV